jgi:hypothetical protein
MATWAEGLMWPGMARAIPQCSKKIRFGARQHVLFNNVSTLSVTPSVKLHPPPLHGQPLIQELVGEVRPRHRQHATPAASSSRSG